MKTNYIILAISCLFISSLRAQELYSEDFEDYTSGYVGSDDSGQTPGQGGWLTTVESSYSIETPFDSLFQIQNDPTHGKVITITGLPHLYIGDTTMKKYIYEAVTNRIAGNDVFKFEVYFYTGHQP